MKHREKEDQHSHGTVCSTCGKEELDLKDPLWKQKGMLIVALSGVIFAAGLYFELFTPYPWIAQGLFLLVVLMAGHGIIKKGVLALWRRRLDMNFLMTIAATGAFLIGHGEEGAAVIYLFYIAELLEDYAAERAKRSVGELLSLAPETATLKRDGKEQVVHVHQVRAGDTIVVKPGDRIPLDGIVVHGTSSVNQAPITGESMPVLKTEGSQVFAGTINEEGYLEIKVTKGSDETILSKIIKIVEEAQREKSPTEAFINRFARYYTPVVVGLAFLVMTVPPLLLGWPFSEWFYRALVLLVVACPCALAISTPVSMVSGITSAARNGVLIKGGTYLEELRKARVVVFDKTGTLTEGTPEVTDVMALNNYSKEKLLQIAASLEARSKHPLADAIVAKAKEEGIEPCAIHNFRSVTGKGLTADLEGGTFYIGNRSFFKEESIEFPEELLERFEDEGKTVVLVGNSEHCIGIIALMDRIRPASFEVVRRLKRSGIKTVMLTGDNERVARAIAKRLALDEYYSELLPEDKVRAIEELLKTHEHVVMIGDGVNDAPALARAHVGIAMGAIGSDVAIDTADVVLMEDDLSKVNYLIRLSKRTMAVVKQNIVASITIKGSLAILAFPGVISLWLAVAAGDMGLSLAVILNALRIGSIR